MFICQCRVVTEVAVTRAVDAGASTLAQVCHSTGAGRVCGGCVFGVKRVMQQHQKTAVSR
jgi:bacterioferritin-associated ferredoxin